MTTTPQISEALEHIVELAEAHGYLYEDYSGRSMFGAKCVGIVTSNPTTLISQALASGILDHRTDSMGRDTIVYWPHIQMPEPTEPVPPSAAELAQDCLRSYLRGYGRGDSARLRCIAGRSQWAVHAAAVLDQRQYKLLDALDDSVLLEIEAGSIDVRAIAALVGDELDAAAAGEGPSHG